MQIERKEYQKILSPPLVRKGCYLSRESNVQYSSYIREGSTLLLVKINQKSFTQSNPLGFGLIPNGSRILVENDLSFLREENMPHLNQPRLI